MPRMAITISSSTREKARRPEDSSRHTPCAGMPAHGVCGLLSSLLGLVARMGYGYRFFQERVLLLDQFFDFPQLADHFFPLAASILKRRLPRRGRGQEAVKT